MRAFRNRISSQLRKSEFIKSSFLCQTRDAAAEKEDTFQIKPQKLFNHEIEEKMNDIKERKVDRHLESKFHNYVMKCSWTKEDYMNHKNEQTV